MSDIYRFLIALFRGMERDDIISKANDLTFKLLLSLFPFVLFLMSLLSYFDMDIDFLMNEIYEGLPIEVSEFVEPFISELFGIRRPQILSGAFIVMLFSASSGFNTAMRGINKAHGLLDGRNFVHRRLISIGLVLVFAVAIVSAMVMLIFNQAIYSFAINHLYDTAILNVTFSFMGYAISVGVLLVSVMMINGFSLASRQKLSELLPGAAFTVVCWVLLSRLFAVYVNNFSNHSALYGSVAGIMLLMIWLNLVCILLLVGSYINALLVVESSENVEKIKS